MPRVCRECGGSSFTVEMGVKMCNQCGMEQVGYMELLSQEAINMVDVSRMTVTKGRGIEHDTSDDEHEKSMDSNDNDKTGEAGMQVLKLLRMIKFGLILFFLFFSVSGVYEHAIFFLMLLPIFAQCTYNIVINTVILFSE